MSRYGEEGPSRTRQWQEKSDLPPVATKELTRDGIEEHRRNLVASYKCKDSDIRYIFEKITDKNDNDRDDCLWLKYLMKCVRGEKVVEREIFHLKIPIPSDVKKKARDIQMNKLRGGVKALPAPKK